MTAAGIAVLLLALAGHTVFWVGTVNRGHALGLARKAVLVINLACLSGVTIIPLLFVWWLARGGQAWPLSLSGTDTADLVAHAYLIAALVVWAAHLPTWIRRRLPPVPHVAVEQRLVRSLDVAAQLGRWPAVGLKARVLERVPGNQLFRLDVDEERVELARLPPELAGISILHLSDFHFSGRIEPEYFRLAMQIAKELAPDLIAVTGDICDKAACIDWIADLLGPLEAPLGKFFVLGNHDLRTRDLPRLRDALAAAGFIDVGSGPTLMELRGTLLLVAGNERPWIHSPDPLPPGPAAANERGRSVEPFKILLSHTPDQFAWARRRGFDLMLAGHTHGGQMCLPWIGPVVCPSRHGVRYAGGIFYEPPTLLHVSRGISSLFPLRLSCPCEMTKLLLERPTA